MTYIPINNQCPCGSLYLPKGKAFSTSGLLVNIFIDNEILELELLHSQDIYLESGEKFVTVTPIITEHAIATKLSIDYSSPITINNVIHVIIKDKLNKAILGTQYIGKYNETTTIDSIDVNLHSHIDLHNNAIIIEIYSLCDNGSDPCCDKLPSEIDIIGPRLLCVPLEQYYILPTTTTTTTPEPFTIEFLTVPTNQIVNINTRATFSFSAISLYDKDFKYWWEKSEDNGSSWKKASRLLIGNSRKINTLVVQASLQMNGLKYRVVITHPKIKYSSIATLFVIQPTTTTTTTTTFNPVTTTLPPCDLQITGFGGSTTTTITSTTTTTFAPTTTTTTTSATTTSTTTTTTTTTATPTNQGYIVTGAGSALINGIYCLETRCQDQSQICVQKLMFTKPINSSEVLDPNIVGMPYYLYKKNTIIASGTGGSLDGTYNFFNNDVSGNPIYYNGSQYIFWSDGCWYVAGEYINHTASSPPNDPSVLCSTPGSVDILPTGLWTNICASGFVNGFFTSTSVNTWEIANGYGVYYYHTTLNETLPPLSGWSVGIGSSPAPTLTSHTCTV